MKTRIALIVLGLFCIFASCKEKPKPAPKPAPKPEVVKDTVQPKPEVKVEKPVKNEVQNYFLIAGCFEYKENADKLCDKLQKEGYDSKIIPYFENLYLVSYNGFPTRSEALKAQKKIVTEKGKEKTWIYKSGN